MDANLAEIRPKLKKDSIFIQIDTGAFFKTEQTEFVLKGKSIYRWLSTLTSYMTGEHTLGEICKGLEPNHKDMVIRLVTTLLERGVVKNHPPEPAGILSDEVRKKFDLQIEFIDHFADRPLERFKTFRESRILLAGSGESFTALAGCLIANGLKELAIAPADGPEKYLQALEPKVNALRQSDIEATVSTIDFGSLSQSLNRFNIIVYCSDGGSLEEVYKLHEACIKSERAFLPAVTFNGQVMIGPLVEPRGGPCWLCALLRYSANVGGNPGAALWQELLLGDDFGDNGFPILPVPAQMLGNDLAFETFNILAGHLNSGAEGGVIFQDLETLEASQARLLRHPLCPSCSHSDPDTSSRRLLELVAKQDGDRKPEEMPDKPEGLLDECYYLINPHIGVFTRLADDEITQVPLKVARIVVSPPTSLASGELEITAFSIENLRDARDTAFKEAIRRYTQKLPDRKGMICASYDQMREEGRDLLLPQQIATWSGSQTLEHDLLVEWMPAFSVFTQKVCYVPASAVYPSSPLNRLRFFERVSVGSAVGVTFDDVLKEGVLSILAYEQLRDVMRGRGSAIALDTEALASLDTDLAYLLKSVERFDRTVDILKVSNGMPLHVIVARTPDAAAERILTAEAGFTGLEAAGKALLNLVGRLQLQQSEGRLPVVNIGFLSESWLDFDLAKSGPAVSSFGETMVTFEQIKDYLCEKKRYVLFVNTTPIDIMEMDALISGVVLLTQPMETA